MTIQAFGYQFQGRKQQLFDPKTGELTQSGRYFFLALWNRTGKGTGIVPEVSPLLVATGATLATALQISFDWNYVGAVPAGSGLVAPPAMAPGQSFEVFNAGANNLNVYPPNVGIQIDALGFGAPYVLAPATLREFELWLPAQMISRP